MRDKGLRGALARLALAGVFALLAAGPAAANALLAPGPGSGAGFLLRVEQQGSNVLVTGSGSFDTGAFSGAYYYPGWPAPALIPGAGTATLNPAGGAVTLMNGNADFWLFTPGVDFVGPTAFGPGGLVYADTTSGDQIGLWGLSGVLALPAGYNANDPIVSAMTIIDATISGLGLTPGDYVWSLGDALGQSFTLQVIPANAVPIPEPRSWVLFGIGLAGLGLLGRRRAARKDGAAPATP